MSHTWHDAGILLVTVIIDLAILAGWQIVGSSLFDRDSEVPAAVDASLPPEPLLHRITGWACMFLLIGLIIESSGLAVVIVARFGLSR